MVLRKPSKESTLDRYVLPPREGGGPGSYSYLFAFVFRLLCADDQVIEKGLILSGKLFHGEFDLVLIEVTFEDGEVVAECIAIALRDVSLKVEHSEFQHRELSFSAALRHRDGAPRRRFHDCFQVFRAFRAAIRIAALAGLPVPLRVGLSFADRIIAGLIPA